MLVWVSKKYIGGGPNLDDDLCGLHFCKQIDSGNLLEHHNIRPCYWDARNDIIDIFYHDGMKKFKILYEGLVTQKQTECGKWYEYELEAIDGKK